MMAKTCEQALCLSRSGRWVTVCLAALLCLAWSNGTHAQTQSETGTDDPAPPFEGVVELQELLITAQRIEQDPLEVPVSVGLVTEEEIARRGSETLSQAIAPLANVSIQDQGSAYNDLVVIRGISNEIPFTDPSVSVFVNGVPRPTGLSNFDLLNVERIEVLRGPQSTLFGQNALAGAVNVVTSDPIREGYQAKASALGGSFGTYGAAGSVEAGFGPEGAASLRLSGSYLNSDGYLRSAETGERIGGDDDYSLLAEARLTPVDWLDISLSVDHSQDVGGGFLDTAEDGSYTLSTLGEEPRDERLSTGVTGVITAYGPGFEVISQTGWRDLSYELDQFASFPAFTLVNTVDTDEDYLFQELRIVGDKGDGRLGWQLGAYFADERNAIDQTSTVAGFSQTFDFTQDTRRYEAFGQVDFDLTDRLTVSAGGRVSRVTRDAQQIYTFFAPSEFAGEESFTNAVGRFAVTYAITPDLAAFGSFAQGFKPGTARSGATNPADLFLPSERSNTVEVGLKGDFGATVFSASAFYTDYQDRHTFFNDASLIVGITSVDEAEAAGFEVSVAHEIMEGWSVFGELGFLHTSFADGTVVPTTAGPIDVGDNAFRAAPKWSGTVGTSYRTELGSGWGAFAGADVTFQSSEFGNISNAPVSKLAGHAIVNASLGVSRGPLKAQLNLENLFDTYYYESSYQSDGRGHPGAPFSIMARISLALGG
ncbi:MAG: TonB-dependent receptor [Pseudomonadota bacterium]